MPTTRVSNARVQKLQKNPAPTRRGRPEKRTEGRPQRASKAKRLPASQRELDRGNVVAVQQEAQADQSGPVPEGTTKIPRVYNELWASTSWSLSFVQHGQLDTDPDTEVIALNPIDHIIKEENWNPALSQNKLCATCFFFAGRVTGKNNAAEDIAAAFEIGAETYASATLAAINVPKYADDYTVRYRIAQALKMSAADVEYGYRILWEQKGSLGEIVGQFADGLGKLPLPVRLKGAEEPALDIVKEDPEFEQPLQETEEKSQTEAAKDVEAEELVNVVDEPLISPAFI